MTQLKTHIFETQKARVLVVDMPEDAANIWCNDGCYGWYTPDDVQTHPLPDEGNWQLLGQLSEISEEQWKGIVEPWIIDGVRIEGFKCYDPEMTKYSGCESATDSGASLIDAWQAAEDQVHHNPVIFWERK